ncbi:MAG: DUF2190 family protein [Magnetococcales bacterium]|nr:DUF2190 family protein [Magnetococcales bacterium]NGZ26104.1 DUF2190 family protein [Magnetococcales bacterium]
MSQQSVPVMALTVTASSAVAAGRFVTVAGGQAGAGVNTLGVARFAAASGELLTVDVLGTAIVEAGAAISLGAAVETDANGKAVTLDAGPAVGRVLQAASGAGSFVEMVLIPN